MASRIIHYAVTEEIIKSNEFSDINRLKTGALLPDAPNTPSMSHNSHFKHYTSPGVEKTYDLTAFREMFKEKILTDDLYLGYYLHLIQDMVYRNFVYEDYKWNPHIQGNVERLHNDYSLINSYIIERYELSNDIKPIEDFETEEIQRMFSFNVSKLLSDFSGDFKSSGSGEIFFFTPEMADEYIKRATEICKNEIDALKSDRRLIDEKAYAWKSDNSNS